MNKKYQEILDVVKADIERVNTNLSFDIDLQPKLKKELEKFLQAPSKRIRSLVTVLFLRASKMYLLPAHYEVCAVTELLHNASLIHDDVIDESKERRNSKSISAIFDNKLAVISGDFLLSVALKKLVKINNNEVTEIFANAVQDMCKGEVNQYFNRFKITDLETYIEKSEQKTASLFEATLQASVLLAGEEYTEKMKEFVTNFGLAFQIRDDLKNFMSDEKTDEKDGVLNAPFILSEDRKTGVEKTKTLLNNYVDCAKHCISDLPESIYKKNLLGLLELLRNV